MASTGQLDIDKLTPDNGAVQTLNELIFLTVLQSEAFQNTINLYPNAVHGKKLGGVGKMGMIGERMQDCSPNWNATKIATQEKMWDLGEFTVAEELCYKDYKETLVRYAMQQKTSVADLTGTEFMDVIITPTLLTAIEDMIWRLYWFGDKDAKNVADGGILTAGVKPKFFDVTDGFFKRLFAITAANPKQRVVIAANAEADYISQQDKMFEKGAATKVMRDLVYKGDIRIRQAKDKVVLCTQSFADALADDVKNNGGSELQWESLFDGLVSATKYNGQDIMALPKWDEMIIANEDNGTTLNKPHRALFTPQSNLFAGIASNDLIAELDIFFDKKSRSNNILAVDEVGTIVWEDDLVQFAY